VAACGVGLECSGVCSGVVEGGSGSGSGIGTWYGICGVVCDVHKVYQVRGSSGVEWSTRLVLLFQRGSEATRGRGGQLLFLWRWGSGSLDRGFVLFLRRRGDSGAVLIVNVAFAVPFTCIVAQL